jgi:hypothetical protein
MILIAGIALLAQAAPNPTALRQGPEPIHMNVAIAGAWSLRFVDLRIELCGVKSKSPTGRHVLTERIASQEFGVEIDEHLQPSGSRDGKSCYVGIWKRRDGKSFQEDVATRVRLISPHGISSEYFLASG